MTNQAILLLAYGGPHSLEDIPAFLMDIRGGRPCSEAFVKEITERYRLIGGKSPLFQVTHSLAEKIGRSMGRPVYVGMRHWHPFIQDTMMKMLADGIRHFDAICLAPHYSQMSIGAYRKAVDDALCLLPSPMTYSFVESWYKNPLYIQALANNIQQSLKNYDDTDCILFTAHSLPERILVRDDPYVEQLRETCNLITEALGHTVKAAKFLCFQSAAQTGEPWLGPQIDTFLPKLHQDGFRSVLAAPIGFVADHVEVLYDIDIAAKSLANDLKIKLHRTQMLNDSSQFVQVMRNLLK